MLAGRTRCVVCCQFGPWGRPYKDAQEPTDRIAASVENVRKGLLGVVRERPEAISTTRASSSTGRAADF